MSNNAVKVLAHNMDRYKIMPYVYVADFFTQDRLRRDNDFDVYYSCAPRMFVVRVDKQPNKSQEVNVDEKSLLV